MKIECQNVDQLARHLLQDEETPPLDSDDNPVDTTSSSPMDVLLRSWPAIVQTLKPLVSSQVEWAFGFLFSIDCLARQIS